MKYLVIPFLIILGFIELILRVAMLVALVVITCVIGWFWLEDERPGTTERLLAPVSFEIAKRIVEC